MNKLRFLVFVFALSLNLFFVSCRHENPFLVTTDTVLTSGTQFCNPDTVYFQNTVLPLLNSGCAMSGCHDAGSHRSGVILNSYTNIVNTGRLVPYNAPISRLYKSLIGSGEDKMPRPPAPPFTRAQKDIIYKWIMQGALNNACSACDTSVYTYSGSIAPMMATYCNGCHNQASAGGGYDFTSYNGVKGAVTAQRLVGSISHQAGYSAMPQGTSALPSCNIIQVQKWIDAGALNN